MKFPCYKRYSEKKKKDEKLSIFVEKKKIQFQIRKLERYFSKFTDLEKDQFIVLNVLANCNEDEALIEYVTKPETIQKEEAGDFMTTNDIRKVAMIAEALGATKITKVNHIGTKKV